MNLSPTTIVATTLLDQLITEMEQAIFEWRKGWITDDELITDTGHLWNTSFDAVHGYQKGI